MNIKEMYRQAALAAQQQVNKTIDIQKAIGATMIAYNNHAPKIVSNTADNAELERLRLLAHAQLDSYFDEMNTTYVNIGRAFRLRE